MTKRCTPETFDEFLGSIQIDVGLLVEVINVVLFLSKVSKENEEGPLLTLKFDSQKCIS